jgi:hypothetical protein
MDTMMGWDVRLKSHRAHRVIVNIVRFVVRDRDIKAAANQPPREDKK